MQIFLGWLVALLISFGYGNSIGTLSNDQVNNLYYAYQQAERLRIDETKFVLLQFGESRGKSEAKGDYRSETGEYLANSCYQFWESTFNKYSEFYNWKGNYNSCKDQTNLAAFMIHQKYENWKHWYNVGNMIGYANRR